MRPLVLCQDVIGPMLRDCMFFILGNIKNSGSNYSLQVTLVGFQASGCDGRSRSKPISLELGHEMERILIDYRLSEDGVPLQCD